MSGWVSRSSRIRIIYSFIFLITLASFQGLLYTYPRHRYQRTLVSLLGNHVSHYILINTFLTLTLTLTADIRVSIVCLLSPIVKRLNDILESFTRGTNV